MGQLVPLAVAIVLLVTTAARSTRLVPEDHVAMILRLGRYHRTAQYGVAIAAPFLDSFLSAINLREQSLSFDTETVNRATIHLKLAHRVVNPYAASFNVAKVRAALQQLIMTILCDPATGRDAASVRRGYEDLSPNWGVEITELSLG